MTADPSRRARLAFEFSIVILVLWLAVTACGNAEERISIPVVGRPAVAAQQTQADARPAAELAASAIGKLEAFDGDVRVIDSRGERRVQVGMTLHEGDAVRSSSQAWAFLAMIDGASITMRPDSELRFDNYRYVPDGEAGKNSAGMALVRGAIRSITGLIGKTNRAAYQIKTQTATISIRGTDHEPAYYPTPPPGQKAAYPPGTYDKVNEGESVIRRPSGEVPVRRGQTVFAHEDVKVRPQILAQPPAFYAHYTQLDQKVVDRRAEFHRQFAQQEERRQQPQKQQDELKKKQEYKGKDDKKQAAALAPKGGKAQDLKTEKTLNNPRGDDRKRAKPAQAAKGEQKVALPAAIQERIKHMQRGDKGLSPAPQQ